ncbi:MAG TPA: alpha-glucan family phosphorylase [Chthoniobacteraceae bacterium]|nr:alpha-glucan family phosphorylase [Chthoniobacteraceae bacterium]
MQPLFTYNVVPKLPAELEPLREMVYNLWWTWEPSARKLFRHLDPDLWDRTNHNPLRMLQLSRQARLEEVARDDDFLRDLTIVHKKFKAYIGRKDTYGKQRKNGCSIAYFSAEFGFHESVPNYSGGLGILAGDHCKSASDLNLNFNAVGLLYRHGYFRQQINKEGWQETVALNQSFHHLPLVEVCAEDKPLLIEVDLPGRKVAAKVWQLAVGRINLYLLDTDIPENNAEDRLITAQLYGGDLEMRIRQEIVLGMGGARALRAMGIQPDVHHMNEGHAAFLALELIRRAVMERKIDYYAGLQLVASGNIFTTHTPVPAGNDAFSRELMERYFWEFPSKVGISFEDFFKLGQASVNATETFSMTILALRTSRHANGVSALHGEVSRGLWQDVWSGVPRDEVPITSITNGIHTKTWMAPEFSALYDKYLGEWEENLVDADFWRGVIDIPDDALWQTHQTLKHRLIDFVRGRIRSQRERLGESMESIRKANLLLDPEILTVGFARRFATYKRGTLLFSDMNRLRRILANKDQPVQFVFSGKSHPKDDGGKKFIQEVYKISREPEFENRIVFVEDYDIYVGRRLTQGVDLWLNNPLRPLEASGTSGMKLPPNGGLNLSVLDGWWCEGYNGKNGWAIGSEIKDPLDPHLKPEFQSEVDSASLFHILETQVIPLYYAKPDGRLPIAWLQLMRESIRSVTPVFNTHRMVKEYNERLYEPAAVKHRELVQNNCSKAVEISQWKARIRHDWPQVRISDVHLASENRLNVTVGETLKVTARIHLGDIDPKFVQVQAYFGEAVNSSIGKANIADLDNCKKAEHGDYMYTGAITAMESGAYGLNVRVIPVNPVLTQAHELRLITWAR